MSEVNPYHPTDGEQAEPTPEVVRTVEVLQASVAPVPVPEPPKGLAIASMVCGIASVICCYGGTLVGLVAVILGAVSLAKKNGGKGMAIAGIITGVVGLLFWLVFIVVMLVSAEFVDLLYLYLEQVM